MPMIKVTIDEEHAFKVLSNSIDYTQIDVNNCIAYLIQNLYTALSNECLVACQVAARQQEAVGQPEDAQAVPAATPASANGTSEWMEALATLDLVPTVGTVPIAEQFEQQRAQIIKLQEDNRNHIANNEALINMIDNRDDRLNRLLNDNSKLLEITDDQEKCIEHQAKKIKTLENTLRIVMSSVKDTREGKYNVED